MHRCPAATVTPWNVFGNGFDLSSDRRVLRDVQKPPVDEGGPGFLPIRWTRGRGAGQYGVDHPIPGCARPEKDGVGEVVELGQGAAPPETAGGSGRARRADYHREDLV